MYQLEFTFAKKHRYEVCTQALVLSDRNPPLDEWIDAASLLKKLREIGMEDKKQLGSVAVTLYDLRVEGVVSLERGERKVLLTNICRPVWRLTALDDVIETRNWLESIEDVT